MTKVMCNGQSGRVMTKVDRSINTYEETLRANYSMIVVSTSKIEASNLKSQFSILSSVDEISPDNCRFWDIKSGEKMDKDRFRQGLGGLTVAYEQALNRILGK